MLYVIEIQYLTMTRKMPPQLEHVKLTKRFNRWTLVVIVYFTDNCLQFYFYLFDFINLNDYMNV